MNIYYMKLSKKKNRHFRPTKTILVNITLSPKKNKVCSFAFKLTKQKLGELFFLFGI